MENPVSVQALTFAIFASVPFSFASRTVVKCKHKLLFHRRSKSRGGLAACASKNVC
jgi:hypothetical protein